MAYKDPAQRRAYMNARAAKIRSGEHIPSKERNARKGDDLICDHCKKSFYRSPANRASHRGSGTGNYCSRACMSGAFTGKFLGENHPRFLSRIELPCDNCGTVVARPPWESSKEGEMTFCNRSCFGEWKSKNWTGSDNPVWNGGKGNYYGPNWIRQSREARHRDGHFCQFCGVNESNLRRALDVHHIQPFRFFGLDNFKAGNSIRNLISLCDKCHTYLEKFSASGELKTWGDLKSKGDPLIAEKFLDFHQTNQRSQLQGQDEQQQDSCTPA
jgi:5-methylcytosine-specific restriction endonuclease McrA